MCILFAVIGVLPVLLFLNSVDRHKNKKTKNQINVDSRVSRIWLLNNIYNQRYQLPLLLRDNVVFENDPCSSKHNKVKLVCRQNKTRRSYSNINFDFFRSGPSCFIWFAFSK